MDLENKLKALEETAQKLDNKDLALDEAIRLFEEGVKQIRACMDTLNESKGKIRVIRDELDAMLSLQEEGEDR